jgi:hypothetical protein
MTDGRTAAGQALSAPQSIAWPRPLISVPWKHARQEPLDHHRGPCVRRADLKSGLRLQGCGLATVEGARHKTSLPARPKLSSDPSWHGTPVLMRGLKKKKRRLFWVCDIERLPLRGGDPLFRSLRGRLYVLFPGTGRHSWRWASVVAAFRSANRGTPHPEAALSSGSWRF